MEVKPNRREYRDITIEKTPCFFGTDLAVSRYMAKKKKNPHAVALGRMGGLKGGKARIAKLTPLERSELARRAVLARWAKKKGKTRGD